MKYSEIERKLKKAGCKFEESGSRHDKWSSPITGRYFYMPRHKSKEAMPGTVKSLSEQSGVKL